MPLMRKTRDDARAIGIVGKISRCEYCRMREYICIYCTICRAYGKKSKIVIAQSMGNVWLVCGIVWQIGILLTRNEHVGVWVPYSGPFLT